ncbi:hypothetical protein BC826DRAFT_1108255 [Russula brevipes]|nr:hypothetical protein BC826DRAFT_1108255 [Russula brevipes]
MATPTPGPTIHPNDLSIPTLGGRTRNDAEEEPRNGMWFEYIKEVKEYDERMINTWKEDANGIFVFTGLFSAIVGVFIIESYKKLSPDQTVALLQQLVDINNGTRPSAPASKPFSPSAAIICVNAMWLISLVLSIASATFATLLQQWAHGNTQMPGIPSGSKERTQAHSFLFFGARAYRMCRVVDKLLHISVSLFFAGLVIFFFTIHKTVAIVVSIPAVSFAVAYLTLTILPCVDHRGPCRTPMSSLCWSTWHNFLLFATHCFRFALGLLHKFLIPSNLGEILSPRHAKLVNRLDILESAVGKHRQRLEDGLEKTIIQAAENVPAHVDRWVLTRLFGELAVADRSNLPKFMASIPREEMIDLMSPPIESRKIVFREHLLSVLRCCAVDARAVGLDEDVRQRSLNVCLAAVHHVVKAFISPQGDPVLGMRSLVDDVRSNFAAMNIMQDLWTDADVAVRVTSRSICALLARLLMRREWFEAMELDWLHYVTGEPQNTIFGSTPDSLDRMNLNSFVRGVLSNQVDDLPTEQVNSFTETLAVLMNAGIPTAFDEHIFRAGLVDLITFMEADGQHDVANMLRQMYLPAPAPTAGPAA